MDETTPQAAIGRIVIFRSRTGGYDVPAVVTATVATLNPKGVEVWFASDGVRGVPPLSSAAHVHLSVLTPGVPGQRASAEDFEVVSPHPISENVAGVYQEWDIPFFGRRPVPGLLEATEPPAGSWRWPDRA